MRPDGTERGAATPALLRLGMSTRCLYYRDPRTRDELRGRDVDSSAEPGQARDEGPRPPDRKGPSRQRGEPEQSSWRFAQATPARHSPQARQRAALRGLGRRDRARRTVPAPSNFCPKPFPSRPTPAPPPFPRLSWRGAPMASYSARSVTTDRTSGPMASSLTMDPPCPPQRARPRSDPGRSRLQ